MTRIHAHPVAIVGLTLALVGAVCAPASAQSLGTLRWQLQPYCNVVSVNVTQQGNLYTADGYDDQCGAPQRAPLVGVVTPNPDGSIGLGLHVVTVPGGRGVQIDARISLTSLGGPWTDSAGNSGTFAFGAQTGGPPRPAPTIPGGMIAPGSITGSQLATGAVGAAQLAPGAINSAAAAFGTCPTGQYLRGVLPTGLVLCEPFGAPATSTTVEVGEVGFGGAIAIGADGLPVISHYDGSASANGNLRITHCGDPACTFSTATSVVSANDDGRFSSIAIGRDGFPVISAYDATNGALQVTHCFNLTCTGATAVNVDTVGDVGQHSSIAIGADGFPIVSYYNMTLGVLHVSHCNDIACAGRTLSVIGTDNNTGEYSSVEIGADGLPIISYYDRTTGDLRVTHCGNSSCSAGNVSTAVDTATDVGRYTSIAIGRDGLPIISYQNSTAGDLQVTHCGNATCSTGNVTSSFSAANEIGLFTSIGIGSDGLPIVSHTEETPGGGILRVTHCANVRCTSATTATAATGGSQTSIAIGTDGFPVVSHRSVGLRVTKCHSRTCR